VIRYWSILGSLLATMTGFEPAEAAPKQLLNKTITYSYTSHYTVRDPSGKTSSGNDTWMFTAYISSAGRIFERSTRQGVGSRDHEPGSSRTSLFGEVRSMRFEGDRLVHMTALVSGASRDTVSFDPTFSSCTVEVILAKSSNGIIAAKGRDGKLYVNLSNSYSGNSCSIRDGNFFAN
jgi:hypothetical protein